MTRPEVDEPVAIVPADPAWADRYEAEAARLAAALAGSDVAFEHIGSTAVPGLAAKPVVDVMLGVAALDAGTPVVERVLALGYTDLGGVPGRRYLARRGEQAFNVQVVERDGELWRANLLLRDFLRRSPDAAARYAAAKRAAAESAPFLLAYSEAKAPALRALLEEASRRV